MAEPTPNRIVQVVKDSVDAAERDLESLLPQLERSIKGLAQGKLDPARLETSYKLVTGFCKRHASLTRISTRPAVFDQLPGALQEDVDWVGSMMSFLLRQLDRLKRAHKLGASKPTKGNLTILVKDTKQLLKLPEVQQPPKGVRLLLQQVEKGLQQGPDGQEFAPGITYLSLLGLLWMILDTLRKRPRR